MSDEIVIDGSRGEGGGQMLRTSLAMSAITGRPLVMENIRAKRSKPGLARQHLSGLLLMKEICSARVEGDSVGSTRVEFAPDAIRHGQYSMDVGTAGSVTLVLQTVLPALASVKGCSEILLTGGTDVRWAPPVDYYRLVLFPMLERVGVRCALEVVQRGYFPQGGGRVKLTISSEGLFKSFDMPDFDRPDVISGIVNITGLPPRIAERIRDSALEALPEDLRRLADIDIVLSEQGPSQGVGIVLAASDGEAVIGASSLGERGKPAETVGREAAERLIMEIHGGGAVDIHASDQLLPYLAMTGGSYSARELTGHARTNVDVIRAFLGDTVKIEDGLIVKFSCKE